MVEAHRTTVIRPEQITGIVLAGGRGSRMGGADKGLQHYRGLPLAQHALERLAPQVGKVMINANRNLDAYAAVGAPVWPDALGDAALDFAGPLAGFLCGLAHCTTEYLVTVPCDAPHLPTDLVSRLAQPLAREGTSVAWASAPSAASPFPRSQPVFCLMKSALRGDLAAFLARGGRKVEEWTKQQAHTVVAFEDQRAFFNANTLEELAR